MVIMESGQELQDLDRRVKRLENVHIWGVGIFIVGLLIFFLSKKNSGGASASMSDGGSVADGVSSSIGNGLNTGV